MAWNVRSGEVKLAALVAPEGATDLERVVEQSAPGLEVQPGRLVLLALPSDAHAEVDATVRQDVEGRHLLGEHDRATQGGQEDVGAEPDPGGPCRHGREDRERLEPVPVGTGGLATALHPARLGAGVGVEVLAEDHVVGHDEAVDPGRVGRACASNT